MQGAARCTKHLPAGHRGSCILLQHVWCLLQRLLSAHSRGTGPVGSAQGKDKGPHRQTSMQHQGLTLCPVCHLLGCQLDSRPEGPTLPAQGIERGRASCLPEAQRGAAQLPEGDMALGAGGSEEPPLSMESVQRAAGLPVSSGVAALKEVIGHERDMVLARWAHTGASRTAAWCGWEGSAAPFSLHPASVLMLLAY